MAVPSLDYASEPRKTKETMKLMYFSNEFPHDDLQDLLRRLHLHSKDQRHPLLALFIEQATLVIREEVLKLPAALRTLIPPIDTLFLFAELADLRKGPLCGSIEGVLLCAVELGALIGYYEEHPTEFAANSLNKYLAGLGIGLLATAAVSLSPALADLPVAGAEVVRLAFRLGVLVDEVSQNLQPRDPPNSGLPDSWAYVVANVSISDVQNELDAIHARANTPGPSKVFISALSPTSVTVSGPPSRLKDLFLHSDFFRDCKHVSLPVYGGLCHAEHIYSKEHVARVVDHSSTALATVKPQIPIFATSTGKPFIATTANELFEAIIYEILTQKIEWNNVINGFLESFKESSKSKCDLLVFRVSLPVNDLMSILETELPQKEVQVKELIPWIAGKETEHVTPRGSAQSKIAIVGMSCRMPSGATDTEKFWDLLEQGLDVHRKIPADRFDVDSHYDPAGKRLNASHTAYGCFIDEPGLFDAPFFNMSPREAQQTDPMQRLALVTAYEALERAGYVANRTAATQLPRIGTFYGQASDDYREVNTAQEISTYFIPGGCRAFGPGRINYFFKFAGPSFSIDTACSSSLATIQAACTSLWSRECDTVVAGGMNVLTNSDAFAGLSHGHFLSKAPNACKTWDAEADGYCRADGIGSIVMKRLEDAEADNDTILGVILGAATNHSAEAVSITHPHAGAQAYLSRQVLRSAGIDPHQVSFVEMHGTGTQAGDHEEMQSVSEVFAPAKRLRSKDNPLYVGAVKANVGHGEAVAGVTALLKVLLMFQKETIPPHVGIKNRLNPAFPKDLDRRNLRIALEKTAWPRAVGRRRIAAVNNFSAAGGNTMITLEEGPQRTVIGTDPRAAHVVVVSAKSKVSLEGNLARLVAYLETHDDTSLADLAYTTTARRSHHNHRVAVAGTSLAHIKKQLASARAAVDKHKPIPPTGPPSVAFAFTGQGSAYKSSDLELYRDSAAFRHQLHHLDALARAQGFPSVLAALDGSFPSDHAHSPTVTQLAQVCTQIALTKYWEALGVKPDVVAGHSLGEYAALHAAGVLSASDAIFLVGKRAQMLEERCTSGSHKMMAVRGSLSAIQQAAGSLPHRPPQERCTTQTPLPLGVEVACVNGPQETVLSGAAADIDAMLEPLQGAGLKCSILDVAFAFHSAQTDPILDDFEAIAKSGVHFHAPTLPIVSPLLAKVVFDESTIGANYVQRATRETVNFLGALETAEKIGTVDETTVWVEIGPHPVCMGFVKSTLTATNVALPSMRRGEDNWMTLSQTLASLHCAGVHIAWNEFHRQYERALRLLDLPTYAWNDKNYWIQYNGDWALTKGNTFYDAEKKLTQSNVPTVMPSSLRTSTVQQIIEETFNGSAGKVVMQADLMQPDFLAAAYGHKMNGCGVVTSSIHADIAYTLGEYLYKSLVPGTKSVSVDIADLVVSKGLVAQKDTKTPQLIQVSITTADIHTRTAYLEWYNVQLDGSVEDPFATSTLYYGDASTWLSSWAPLTHLIQGRIEALERLAEEGIANRFSHSMTYRLFAANLVDYADKYRGMRSVVLHELESFADIQLTTEKGGTWTVPPYFIDSVAHLAGFTMNVSDAIDTKANFCVTPGWSFMRFARPLVAGAEYRSYVKMIPTVEDPATYLGDVYILQDNVIIGMVGAIKFCRYPRILLDRFFSAPDAGKTSKHATSVPTKHVHTAALAAPKATASAPAQASKPAPPVVPKSQLPPTPPELADVPVADTPAPVTMASDSTAAKAILLIAKETAIEAEDLEDEASFADLGVDSLMSLVIAEKFREELGVIMSGSLFLEYPTVGDLRAWLLEYHS